MHLCLRKPPKSSKVQPKKRAELQLTCCVRELLQNSDSRTVTKEEIVKRKVAIRSQQDDYLAYFYEQRTTIRLNQQGAEILEAFLNEDKNVDEIAQEISSKYDVDEEQAKADIKAFLKDIYHRITTTNINEAEQEKLDKPIGVEIEITTACNLRCKHCFQGEYPEVYMSFEKFKDIVDILSANDVYEVNLVGGEIFKHADVLKMLEYLDTKDMAVTIVTNAVAIDEEALAVMTKMKSLYVLVSVDGTKELHDQIRGTGMFDLIIPKIIHMRDLGMNIEILCTINAINVNHVKEIADFGKSIGVPVNFNLFKPFSEKHEYLTVDPIKFFKAVEDLLRLRIKENYRIGVSDASLAAYMLGLPEKNECTATMAGLVINTNGRMLTCPYLLEAGYYKESELPKFTANFVEEWKNGEYFETFRKNGQKGCQARALIFSGDVTKGDPYDLNSYKKYRESLKG